MRKRLPVVGDVLKLSAFPSANVVAHYVRFSPDQGPFVTFYKGPLANSVESLSGYQRLFGPVSVGINPPARSGKWQKIGSIPPTKEEASLPLFLMATPGVPPHQPPVWWLNDNGRQRVIGNDVPEEWQDLELLVVWPAELIEERIMSGENPHSYERRMRPYWI